MKDNMTRQGMDLDPNNPEHTMPNNANKDYLKMVNPDNPDSTIRNALYAMARE